MRQQDEDDDEERSGRCGLVKQINTELHNIIRCKMCRNVNVNVDSPSVVSRHKSYDRVQNVKYFTYLTRFI